MEPNEYYPTRQHRDHSVNDQVFPFGISPAGCDDGGVSDRTGRPAGILWADNFGCPAPLDYPKSCG